MKICIVGGGNIGTAMAVEFAHNGHAVNVLTSRPREWSKTLTAVDSEGHALFDGEIELATSDVKTALAGVDYVIVTLPSNVQAAFAESAAPFVDDNMKFVMNPGFGGSEFLLRKFFIGGGRSGCNASMRSRASESMVVWFGSARKSRFGSPRCRVTSLLRLRETWKNSSTCSARYCRIISASL